MTKEVPGKLKDWVARKRAKSAVKAGYHGGKSARLRPVGWIGFGTKVGGSPPKTACAGTK